MSLRKLPEIKAFENLAGLEFTPDRSVLSKWNPAIHAAEADNDATISIYDVIGEDPWGDGVGSKRIAAALRKIGARDVVVNINSPGGDFFEGTSIYSILRDHPAKVTVRVMGLAASAASVIAMAGDEIEISDVGFIMVHDAWALALGNRHDMRAAADMLEPFDDAMAGVYASRTGADKAVTAKWMDDETWFGAERAIEAGLADRIMDADLVEEKTNASMKSLAAARRVEAALASQGLNRNERRSLIGEMSGRPAVADSQQRSAVASDITADIHRLIEKIKS